MAGTIDLSLCAACHCLAARRDARAITRFYEAKLRRHGLRVTQFSVLAVLALSRPLPMGELAERLGVERTTLTRSAALLVASGWVRADRSGDERERPLGLTRTGRRKLEAAYPAWKEAQDVVGRRSARAGSVAMAAVRARRGASRRTTRATSLARIAGTSGLAAMLGGALFPIGIALHPLRHGEAVNASAYSAVHVRIATALFLLLFGLVGLYVRQAEELGRSGRYGFMLAFAGNAWTYGLTITEEGAR